MATHELEILVSSKTQSSSILSADWSIGVGAISKTQSSSTIMMTRWLYLQYEYAIVTYDMDGFIAWMSADTRCYFAVNASLGANWVYFAGNGDHKLTVDQELTSYGSVETDAKNNYLQTTRDPNGRMRVKVPSFQDVKFVRMYIDELSPTTIYEFWPTLFLGREIDFKLAAILGAI